MKFLYTTGLEERKVVVVLGVGVGWGWGVLNGGGTWCNLA